VTANAAANGAIPTGQLLFTNSVATNLAFIVNDYTSWANGKTRQIYKEEVGEILTFPVATFNQSDQSGNTVPPIKGQIFIDSGAAYLFVCTANGTIKRTALSSF
jgi:hypothetical protein